MFISPGLGSFSAGSWKPSTTWLRRNSVNLGSGISSNVSGQEDTAPWLFMMLMNESWKSVNHQSNILFIEHNRMEILNHNMKVSNTLVINNNNRFIISTINPYWQRWFRRSQGITGEWGIRYLVRVAVSVEKLVRRSGGKSRRRRGGQSTRLVR